jgi:serine/threonine protein phosphatase 1
MRFALNTEGRDFLFSDPHDTWDELREALQLVKFNEETDRLFMAGDGNDRGPQPLEYVHWLAKPWFFSLMGNHEYTPICIVGDRNRQEGQKLVNIDKFVEHGGQWFLDLSPQEQDAVVDLFSALPFAFEIETPHGKVGVVHAEPFETWEMTVGAVEGFDTYSPTVQQAITNQLFWSRDRSDAQVHLAKRNIPWTPYPIPDIWRVYVGHAQHSEVMVLDNIYYIDTAVVYGNKLTLVNLTDNTLVQVPAKQVYWQKKS